MTKTVDDLVTLMRAALKVRSDGEYRMTAAHAAALLDEIERLRAIIERYQQQMLHVSEIVRAPDEPSSSPGQEIPTGYVWVPMCACCGIMDVSPNAKHLPNCAIPSR